MPRDPERPWKSAAIPRFRPSYAEHCNVGRRPKTEHMGRAPEQRSLTARPTIVRRLLDRRRWRRAFQARTRTVTERLAVGQRGCYPEPLVPIEDVPRPISEGRLGA